jgi:hypothetical protein
MQCIRAVARLGQGVCLIHCIRAKVNTAGPFHAAEIGIDGDGVEDTPSESGAAAQANSWRIFWSRRLSANVDDPKHLLTVHGVGYKLVL